jgi:hypothetical protein
MGGYDFPRQIAASDGSEGKQHGQLGHGDGLYRTGESYGNRIYPSGPKRRGHGLDEGGNGGPTRSSDRGERERELSCNGGS